MKKNAYITLILTLTFLITASGCSSYATTDITTAAITSVATAQKEPTETAAIATTTPTPTLTTMEAVVMLTVTATYASLYDGTKIYSDGSRTVVLKTLVKGDQVTITGTAGQYGVTPEGSFVNLHLMSVVVTVTPTSAETTVAPTDPTASTTKAPSTTTKATTAATTKAPAATTKATTVATTAAPPVETSPPVATTAAYTPNCDNIRSLIVSNLQSRGYWFPDAASNGGGSASVTTNYFYSDDKFAEGFLKKFTKLEEIGTAGIVSISVWIENGYVCFSHTDCAYPTA
ncbi:MAG: hypothetical protein WCG21_14335 [Eubacteriales bacterium]